MFQSSKRRLQALLELVDDMLADPGDPVDSGVGTADSAASAHPHRRPVTLRIERRAGAVSAREMHCLCPVRRERPAAPTSPTRTVSGRPQP